MWFGAGWRVKRGEAEGLNIQKTMINVYLDMRILLSKIKISTGIILATDSVLIEWLRLGKSNYRFLV